jgi:ABC-2 type transport system ATP-binding protein
MVGLEIVQVVKSYVNVQAVRGLSFKVQPGQIFALLGPNGAGKSSLIRMLVGLTVPDSGSIRVTYEGKESALIPEGCSAYLPEDRGLYLDKTITENLMYIGFLRGMSRAQIKEKLDYWLARLDLLDKVKDNLSKLSKGNQQKVQLISCLLHEPKLLILDEPFSGLDPINQEHVLDILTELKQQGTTILLSAHQMALVERVADRMLLLNKGEMVAGGSLQEVIAQLSPEQCFQVKFTQAIEMSSLQALASAENVQQISAQEFTLQLAGNANVNQLLQSLIVLGELSDFSRVQPSLHDLYLRAVTRHNQQGQQQGDPQQQSKTVITKNEEGVPA